MNTKVIMKNFGANSISMSIILFFQLISVPVFIKYWGVELYGEWIVLSSLTTYLAMSDIGLNTATANQFSLFYVKNKHHECEVLLTNNIVFLFTIFSVFFVLLIEISEFGIIDWSSVLKLRLINTKIAHTGILILFAQIFIGTLNNMLNTIYRATQCYARGMMIDNVIRVCENIVFLTGVILSQSLVNILLLVLSVKVGGLFLKYSDSKKYYLLHVKISNFSFIELKRMTMPALSFLSFPIANSFMFQGYTLLINYYLGSSVVVLYNTIRTFVSIVKSGLSLITNTFWPELSLAFGRNDKVSLRMMHRYAVIASFGGALGASLFLFATGKQIYSYWTGGQLEYNYILFYSFILVLIADSLWNASSIVLTSTNNHKMFSMLYLISATIALSIASLIIVLIKNISYVPLSQFVIDIIMIVFVFKKTFTLLEESIENFLLCLKDDINKLLNFIRP